ncbi:MAG: hypothetical protein PSV46_17760 [Reyranella sp.]|nr:hypothetical protein [Reyranella sp.]
MSIQLPLPASWAGNLQSRRDPGDRLDELVQDKLDAKAEIRAILDRLAEKYGVPVRDVHDAVGWIDDGLEDLLYDIELGFHHEMEDVNPV